MGESVVIHLDDGRSLTLTVLRTRRGQVKLGIEAPTSVPIRREQPIAPKGGKIDV